MSVELQHIFSGIQKELEGLKGNKENYPYHQHNIDKERHDVLMCNETKDIQAYPGTGKTTLLVDKLSLLLKHWNLKHRGVVVLSHTNVAKNEIIKLSKTYPELGKLLYYPHYIGTIHNFANIFLGLPYVRSKFDKINNIRILPIDELFDIFKKIIGQGSQFTLTNEFVSGYNKKNPKKKYKKNQYPFSHLEQRHLPSKEDFESYIIRHKLVNRESGSEYVNVFANDTNTLLQEKLSKTYSRGYFSHDSLLHFSLKMIEENNFIVSSIRKRFPIVIIDEAQDNSKLQSELLHKLFVFGENPSIVQRFGDINQAIYGHETFDNWNFPHRDNQLEIKSSHRCKKNIAEFASKFVSSGGGFEGVNEGGHLYYILFKHADKNHVLEKFTNKVIQLNLCNTIPNFSAIAIGKDGRLDEVNKKNELQLKINSYLPTFSKDINKVEHKQKSFLEGLSFAKMIIENEGNVNKAYKVLIQCLQKEEQYYNKSKEEAITTLKNCHILLSKYFGLIKNSEQNTCKQICQALNIEHTQINSVPQEQRLISNTYTDNGFNVRVDTIHGVKGETHHATLVLDTFTHFNTMNNILKHKLQSAKLNGKGGHAENKAILELYFVAFSRATDLLCLAIEDTANDDIATYLQQHNFQKL